MMDEELPLDNGIRVENGGLGSQLDCVASVLVFVVTPGRVLILEQSVNNYTSLKTIP